MIPVLRCRVRGSSGFLGEFNLFVLRTHPPTLIPRREELPSSTRPNLKGRRIFHYAYKIVIRVMSSHLSHS